MDIQPYSEIYQEQYDGSRQTSLSAPPSVSPGARSNLNLEPAVQALNSDKQQHLLTAWNATQYHYAAIPLLHTLFEQQVAEIPDALAVISEERALTYAALNGSAAHLAGLLQDAGVGPEILVAVYLERSFEMVNALLAILKAGGAYVPLDPATPPERLAFIFRDCAPSVVITQSHIKDRLPSEYRGRILVLDDLSLEPESSSAPLCWQGNPLQAANLLYTSGSTGQPKGVINTHQGLHNRLFWMQDRYRLKRTDRVLQKTPYSFDVSLWEILWPFQVGATLVLARPDGHKDSTYLAQLLNEQSITVAHFVPSMLQIFLDEPGLTRCATLRYVFCSGEVLSAELQQRCFERLDAELHNLYGPTEAAIDVTAWACKRGSMASTVPIGSPIYNTQIILLDQHGTLVPQGMSGELYIGGMGLARGYHQRPDLTAECFRPYPGSPDPGARLYKTGDLARERPDHNFEYIGRLDHQVKLRGQRIELEEIEIALARHPGVRSCLVQVQTFAANDQRLVAYLIPESELKPTFKELLRFLRLSLPAYMIPSVFMYLEAWPLLSNGKINRRALPAATGTRTISTHMDQP